jgi:TatD DNase family protein
MQELIDIGLNLTHDSFDRDRDQMLARASEAGVRRFIVTGTSVAASSRALELAATRPGQLFATAGVHPHHASEFDEHSAAALRRLLRDKHVVAVGECGLDFYRDFSSREDQEKAFTAQLALAEESKLPVFLHQRDAHEDFLRHLTLVRDKLTGGVAHCFTGGREELRSYLDLDLYIGVTGWVCDERRGRALREALPDLPLNRLLIETDAPYLLPRDLRPIPKNRRNEPSFLPHVLQRVAEEMNRPIEAVAAATRRNTEALFDLPPATQAPLL